jgi:hypothetical protein
MMCSSSRRAAPGQYVSAEDVPEFADAGLGMIRPTSAPMNPARCLCRRQSARAAVARGGRCQPREGEQHPSGEVDERDRW